MESVPISSILAVTASRRSVFGLRVRYLKGSIGFLKGMYRAP